MKNIIISFCLLLCIHTISAFQLGVGIKAGLSLSSFYGTPTRKEINRWQVNPYSGQIADPNFSMDINFLFNIIKNLGLQAELKIGKRGQRRIGNVIVNGSSITSKPENYYESILNIPYIEFPILMKLMIPFFNCRISFYSGCAFSLKYKKIDYNYSYGNSSQAISSDIVDTIDSQINKFAFSIPFGTLFEIKAGPGTLVFDCRYQLGLTDVYHYIDYYNKDKIKSLEMEIGYCYYFNKK